MTQSSPDIAIIGSGMGGATLAAALAPSGRSIVILERGERLADTPAARDDLAIFCDGAFLPKESWRNAKGELFNPGNYYYVGGNTKFYGAVLLRFRSEDFAKLTHLGGVSPAWPISYETFEPWYQAAEEMFWCVGTPHKTRRNQLIQAVTPLPRCPMSRGLPKCAKDWSEPG